MPKLPGSVLVSVFWSNIYHALCSINTKLAIIYMHAGFKLSGNNYRPYNIYMRTVLIVFPQLCSINTKLPAGFPYT